MRDSDVHFTVVSFENDDANMMIFIDLTKSRKSLFD